MSLARAYWRIASLLLLVLSLHIQDGQAQFCQWRAWTAWSSWNRLCGCGVRSQTRTRSCRGNCGPTCSGYPSQSFTCPRSDPRRWSAWGSWGPCGTSCGTSTRSRSRSCLGSCGSCSGSSSASRSCNAGAPRSYTNWSGWSACSTSCGTGVAQRSRSCQGCHGSCSGPSSESRNCQDNVPRYWGNWGPWGSCGTSCGTNTRSRSRSCLGSCGSCSGSSSASQSCNAGAPRSYTPWSSWGACSTSCGTGSTQRSRSCQGCYGGCSGGSSDSRSCTDNVPASWNTWSGWSACSRDCGPGTRSRRRQCTGDCQGNCPLGAIENDSSSCEVATPRSWASWAPWGACEGCGMGQRSRTRLCEGTCEGSCEESAVEPSSEACPADEPAAWSIWSSYSVCSAVCGDGMQTRTRTCEGECTGTCPEIGGIEMSDKSCTASALAVPGQWSDWGPCDANICGQGNRTRTRTCSAGCPSEDCSVSEEMHTESQFCQSAYYSAWTPWSETCSNTCGAGALSRTRTCLGLCTPSGAECEVGARDVGTMPCNGGPAAKWRTYEPQVCQGEQRPWVRECDQRCHGSCDGSATEMRNCTWAPLIAWAGPLYPTSAALLTAAMVETISSFLRDAVVVALDKGEAVLGTVAPLRDSVPDSTDDGSADRRRREGPMAFVDASLVVSQGQELGSIWLRMEIEVLPEVELEAVAALPVHTGNVTGRAHALAPQGIVLSLTAPARSKASDGKSAAGAAVGVVIACLMCIVIALLLVRRRRAQISRSKMETGQSGGEPWMTDNPLYKGEGNLRTLACDQDTSSVSPEAWGLTPPATQLRGTVSDTQGPPGNQGSGATGVYDTYGAPLQGHKYQAFGLTAVSASGQYDPLQHGTSPEGYSAFGLQSVVNSPGYNHFEHKAGYEQFGDRLQSGGGMPGYDHMQAEAGEKYQPLGCEHLGDRYSMMSYAHPDNHGADQQVNDDLILSGTGRAAGGFNGEGPGRRRGGDDIGGGEYLDVLCGAAKSYPPPLPPKKAPQSEYHIASRPMDIVATYYEDAPPQARNTAPPLTERRGVVKHARSGANDDDDGQYFDVSCGVVESYPPPLPPKRAPQAEYDQSMHRVTAYEDVPPDAPPQARNTAPPLMERRGVVKHARSGANDDDDGQDFDVSCGVVESYPPPLPPKRAPQAEYDLASQSMHRVTAYEDVPPNVTDTVPPLIERRGAALKPERECVTGEDAWIFLQIVTGCSLTLSSGMAATLVTADGAPVGTFVVRRSTRAANGLVLTFKSDGGVIHEHITVTAKGRHSLCGRARKTLSLLLRDHCRHTVGTTTTRLTGFAPAIEQAAAEGLRAALESWGAPEVEVDGHGRPTGSWGVGTLLRVAQAAVRSGAAAAVSRLPPAAAAAVGTDALLSSFVSHWSGGASDSRA